MKLLLLNCLLYKTNHIVHLLAITLAHVHASLAHDIFQVSTNIVTKYGDLTTFYFNADFNSEPNIVCAWSFGDGTSALTQKSILENGTFSHRFQQPGTYQTLTSCLTSQGILDKTTIVVVDEDISYIDCWFVDASFQERRLFLYQQETLFLKFQTSNVNSIKFYSLIDDVSFKDDKIFKTLQPLVNQDVIEGYLNISASVLQSLPPGEHTISLAVYNKLIGLKCDEQFFLVEKLSNMAIKVEGNSFASGTYFSVEVSADKGNPADVRWKVIDLASGDVVWARNSTKSGTTSQEFDSIELRLEFPGTYTVEVTYANVVMKHTKDTNITIQNPVLDVAMVTNSPLHFPAENLIILVITFGHPDMLPSRPFYNVSFGDTYHIKNVAVPENVQIFNITQHLGAGLYPVTLDIFNEVSFVRTLDDVAVLQDISNIVILSYKDGSSVPATYLPVEYPVNFELELSGTAQHVEWNFNGHLVNTSTTYTTWTFEEVGYNNISVTVSTAFSSNQSLLQIILLHGITDIFLVNSGPVMLTENITFILFVKILGTDSTFILDTGDHNIVILDRPVKHDNILDYLPQDLNLPFNPTMYYSTVLHYEYALDGKYIANATAFNRVNVRTSSSTVFVQLRPCLLPDIHIRDGSEVSSNLFQYKRYQNILFVPTIKLDCQGSVGANYDWKVFKIAGVFSIPDKTNEYLLPSTIKRNLKEFYISNYMLDYGYYIFQLTVTMVMRDGSLGISNVDHSVLEVVETPIVARIYGGSMVITGWYNNITIDGSDSYDPDSATPKFIYNWFCRRSNETFPEDIIHLIDLKSSSGGCFQEGLYVTSSTDSKLFLPAQTLEGNQTFVFRLVITEPGRVSASTEQTIYISPGNPPSLSIRCMMNCGTFLNPSERFILYGKCGDCTEFTRPTYRWYFVPSSSNNVKQRLVWGEDTTTSRFNAYLSIHANVFNSEKSESYVLRLRIKSWSGTYSYSEISFTTNARPRIGNCTVNPTQGFVVSTLFSMQCLGFYDDDLPLHYIVHAETGAEKVAGVSSLKDTGEKGSLLYYGVDPVFTPTLLPVGIEANDYEVKINIKVLDTYGAHVDSFMSVKVIPPPLVKRTIEDVALEMTTSDDSQLEQLLTEGDTQSAVQLITMVGSLLNAEAEKSVSEPVTTIKKKPVENKAEIEKKQKRTEAREAIIESIQKVEIRDMESLKQTSAAITQVTQEKEEITEKAQRSAAEAYVNMGNYLKEQSNVGVGGEAVEGTARYIVTGLSNIMDTALSASEEEEKSDSTEHTTEETDNKIDNTAQNRNVTLVSLNALDQVKSAILVNKVPGEVPTFLKTDTMSVVLQKQEKWDLAGFVYQDAHSGITFRLPDNIQNEITSSNDEYDEVISIKMNNFKSNPFNWDETSSSISSQVTSLELAKSEGVEVNVEHLSETINIFIDNPQDITVEPLPGVYIGENTTSLTYGFNVTDDDGSVVILVNPYKITFNMTLYLRYELPANGTEYDLAMTLPLDVSDVIVNWNKTTNLTGDVFTMVINTVDLPGVGSYFITVETESKDDNYTLSAFMAKCLYWNQELEQWNNDGCQVGILTTSNRLHCQCSHLTFFGGSFLVLPNTIDFIEDAKLFKGFLDNPIVITTVIVVFCLQVLCSIWARRKDETDQLQAHVIILHDNHPLHEHRYHVTIFTGMRKGAGTSAVVTLTLSGTLGNSDPHVMTSLTRHVMCQGSADSFLLTTEDSLGDLCSIRVWHDNSGSHPAWYLSRILIHEIDSDKWWYFLCKTWLAVDIDDCIIDKTFYATTEDELQLFHNIFFIKSLKDLRDGHLWFSVITRPPRSRFSRLERVSCCFSILLTTMLTSIMFYGIPDDPEAQDLDFGKFQISWRDVIIGIESSILVFPVNFLTVTLFRNARPKPDETAFLEIEGLTETSSDTSDNDSNESELHSSTSSVDLNEVVITTENQYPITLASFRKYFSNDKFFKQVEGSLDRIISLINLQTEKRSEKSFGFFRRFFKNRTQNIRSVPSIQNSVLSSIDLPNCQSLDSILSGFKSDSMSIASEEEKITNKSSHEKHDIHLNNEKPVEEQLEELIKNVKSMPSNAFVSEFDREEAILMLESISRLYKPETSSFGVSSSTVNVDTSKDGCLPWWIIYIAWFILLSCEAVSAYVIMLYGLKYGRQQSLDWLMSILISFFQNIIVIQPLKMFVVAALLSLLFRVHQKEDVGVQFFKNLHIVKSSSDLSDTNENHTPLRRKYSMKYYRPPPTQAVQLAREKRQAEAKMHSMIQEFFGQVILVWLVMEIAYTQQDPNSFYFNNIVQETFTDSFDEINNIVDLYEWLQETAVPAWFNKDSEFQKDTGSVLINTVRIRQLRVLPDSCVVANVMNSTITSGCASPLYKHNLDKSTNSEPWSTTGERIPGQDIWSFQHKSKAKGSYYIGSLHGFDRGGHIVELPANEQVASAILVTLQDSKWLDKRTRVVYIEWMLYNADVNLFCSCTLVLEFPGTGSVIAASDFLVMRLYRFTSNLQVFVMVLEVTYIFVLLFMIYKESTRLYHRGFNYFNVWSTLTLGNIIASLTAIILYSIRQASANSVLKLMKSDPNKFVSFYDVAVNDQALGYVIALIVVFTTLKLLKILRFNNSIFLMSNTLNKVSENLMSYVCTILIAMFVFCTYSYLIFGPVVCDFSTLISCLETITVILMGGPEIMSDVYNYFPVIGAIFFLAVTLAMTYLLINVFIAMIMDTFIIVRRNFTPCSDKDVISMLVEHLYSLFAIRRRTKSYDSEQIKFNI